MAFTLELHKQNARCWLVLLCLSGRGLYLSERRVSGEILLMLITLNASNILSFREENEVITVSLLDFVCVCVFSHGQECTSTDFTDAMQLPRQRRQAAEWESKWRRLTLLLRRNTDTLTRVVWRHCFNVKLYVLARVVWEVSECLCYSCH